VTSADRCHEFGCDTHAPAASPNLINLAPYHKTLIKTIYSVENAMFIVYKSCLLRLWQHNVTFGRLTTLSYNVLEIYIFCHRYLKMNNSAMSLYFLAKFVGSFTNIFRNICTQFCQDAFRFAIFVVHCLGGYFFPDMVYIVHEDDHIT